MFNIYDTKTKRNRNLFPLKIRGNAESVCQKLNIENEGIEETDKPASKRRFVIREV